MPTKTEMNVRFSSGVDLSDDTKSKLIALLNARLADTIDAKTQVKHAHWNVKGLQFQQLHLLFDDATTHVDDAVDLIAERAVQLGGVAHGTARIVAKTSSIPEYDLDAVKGEDHVGSPPWPTPAAKPLTKPTNSVTRRLRTSLPRSCALPIRTCGSSKRISRPNETD